MDIGSPTGADFLFHRPSGEPQPALVDECTTFVGCGNPDHQRRCIGYRPETFVTFSLGSLCSQLLEFRDIGAYTRKPGGPPVRIAQPRATPLNPASLSR